MNLSIAANRALDPLLHQEWIAGPMMHSARIIVRGVPMVPRRLRRRA
jgi:hypothetical protein